MIVVSNLIQHNIDIRGYIHTFISNLHHMNYEYYDIVVAQKPGHLIC